MEAGVAGAAAIRFLPVAGDGNQAEPGEAGQLTQVRGELVAVHHRQAEVEEHDVG